MRGRSLAWFATLVLGTTGCGDPELVRPDDDWPTATPESRGIDSAKLASLVSTLDLTDSPVHQMSFVAGGALVSSTTFYPYSTAYPHDVASVTKSVTATLVGIAIDRGFLASVHQKLVDFFPERAIANLDGRKRAIEIQHLLTMTSGFDCGLAPGEPELLAMLRTGDWVGYSLDLPMHDAPGARFAYCSSNHHLLSAIVTRATGMTLAAFAAQTLFGPLGIESAVWPDDPQGLSRGWGDLELSPSDMARLGQTYLDGGRWRGGQVVPAQWVADAWTPVVAASDTDDYGLSWWIPHTPAGIYLAEGRGGQYIAVWPKHSLVTVMTAGGADLGALAPTLLTALSDSPLADNPEGLEQLRRAEAAAALPPVPVPVAAPPAIAQAIAGRTYALSSNPLGLESLSVAFPTPDEATLAFVREGERYALRVGLDGVPRFSENRLGSPAAVVGRWQGDELVLLLDEVALINRFSLRLAFAGDALTAQLEELSSSLFPTTTFTGTASE